MRLIHAVSLVRVQASLPVKCNCSRETTLAGDSDLTVRVQASLPDERASKEKMLAFFISSREDGRTFREAKRTTKL